ncbi:type II secretion system protein [Verrucomicrobiaceae bacterium N1E253]|uniref:Type II secretion system protein n=1 Tax=Oceaniferula marina TaxID=2748318 RepID=A0A851GAT7_9BACT|nr:type II secretion system protein [Oceaniferula marina]NWK54878.1 type II secretion system protein [Oceaniferula marina]
MKLTTKAKANLKPGMTLIELTVVIIVLLTLISVLFFAGTAYIKSSNRTACLANQTTFQKAIRGYASLKQIEAGKAVVDGAGIAVGWDTLTTDGFIGDTAAMSCPTAKTLYVLDAAITNPPQGAQVVVCPDADYKPTTAAGAVAAAGVAKTDADGGLHTPADIGNW